MLYEYKEPVELMLAEVSGNQHEICNISEISFTVGDNETLAIHVEYSDSKCPTMFLGIVDLQELKK